jgi:hypothetical protein
MPREAWTGAGLTLRKVGRYGINVDLRALAVAPGRRNRKTQGGALRIARRAAGMRHAARIFIARIIDKW